MRPKGRTPERRIMVWIHKNISFTFQEITNLYAHLTYPRFRLFWKCFNDFWVDLGRNVLKGLVKFMEKGNLEDLMLFLNRNLTINIYKTYTKQLSTNVGSTFRGGVQLSGGAPKPPEISLIFTFTPALSYLWVAKLHWKELGRLNQIWPVSWLTKSNGTE